MPHSPIPAPSVLAGLKQALKPHAPFAAMFLAFPDAIMHGLFARGAFNATAADAAGRVLIAYASGLPAFVLIRTVTPLFHSRGDTRTPVIATVTSLIINLGVKLLLIVGFSFGAVGLAMGTAVGGWINLAMLVGFAWSRGILKLDERLTVGGPRIIAAALFTAVVAFLASPPLMEALAGVATLRNEIHLVLMGLIALGAYGVALMGVGWTRR